MRALIALLVVVGLLGFWRRHDIVTALNAVRAADARPAKWTAARHYNEPMQ